MIDKPLSAKRILISNDDGIQAEGLAVLERIARKLTDDVWVVAPQTEQSAASHSLTIHRPLRLDQVGERRFSANGTPTDCVVLALHHVLRDHRPDLVLSGVNHGSNLGEDVTYSGTVAAAMEATLLGIPAVAFSLDLRDGVVPAWGTVEHWGTKALLQVLSAGWPADVLININFPAVSVEQVTGIHVAKLGIRTHKDNLERRVDPRGRAYFWIAGRPEELAAPADTDLGVLRNNGVSLTPLLLDLTHYDTVRRLSDVLGGPTTAK